MKKNKFFVFFIAVIFLSLFFIVINKTSAVTCDSGTIVGGVCLPSDTGLPDPVGGISQIISNILSWLLGIFSVIAIAAFVISGIQYLTSAGEEDQITTAKRNTKYALLGIVIGLSGFIIVQAINSALGGTSVLF